METETRRRGSSRVTLFSLVPRTGPKSGAERRADYTSQGAPRAAAARGRGPRRLLMSRGGKAGACAVGRWWRIFPQEGKVAPGGAEGGGAPPAEPCRHSWSGGCSGERGAAPAGRGGGGGGGEVSGGCLGLRQGCAGLPRAACPLAGRCWWEALSPPGAGSGQGRGGGALLRGAGPSPLRGFGR